MKTDFNHFWPVYKNLEEETLQLTKYIQFTDEQLGVYSMYIADLLVRCAMEIEALSKELYWKNGGTEVYGEDGKKRDLFFDTDCIAFLNELWGICKKEVLVSSTKFYFEKSENRIISPLYKAEKRSGAKWNKAYQAVKHDRKNSLRQGKIENLISALGALFILNLYYADEKIQLGITDTPSKAFDNRMGSEIFAATYTDATVDVQIGESLLDDAISDKMKDKLLSSVYVIKYTDYSWKNMYAAIKEDSQKLRNSLKMADSFKEYCEENPEEVEKLRDESLYALVNRFLGKDYIYNHNGLGKFGRAFMGAQKEVIINKKKPIYG